MALQLPENLSFDIPIMFQEMRMEGEKANKKYYSVLKITLEEFLRNLLKSSDVSENATLIYEKVCRKYDLSYDQLKFYLQNLK